MKAAEFLLVFGFDIRSSMNFIPYFLLYAVPIDRRLHFEQSRTKDLRGGKGLTRGRLDKRPFCTQL
jgi:hypothetical protein